MTGTRSKKVVMHGILNLSMEIIEARLEMQAAVVNSKLSIIPIARIKDAKGCFGVLWLEAELWANLA